MGLKISENNVQSSLVQRRKLKNVQHNNDIISKKNQGTPLGYL